MVAEFLHQNGLRRVGEADRAGWWPLHYAALSGDTEARAQSRPFFPFLGFRV